MLYTLQRTPQGIVPVANGDDSSIVGEVQISGRQHGAGLRTDQLDGTSAVSGARAQMRAFVRSLARQAHALHGVALPDEARLDSIAATLAEAAGYTRNDAGWTHELTRNDASTFFEDELTDRNGLLRRPKQKKRVLSEGLPVRSVDAYAERYESRYLAYEGNVTHLRPGSNVVGTAGFRTGSKKRDIHTFATSVVVDWLAALQGSRSAVNHAAENAEAVRRIFADFHEGLITKGIGDAASFWALNDLPIIRLPLAQDYSGAVTMADAFADFAVLIGNVLEAHEDRGDSPNVLMMGTRLARKLIPLNNIAAGGDMTGIDLRMKLARLFDDTGIERFVMTPSLNNWQGDTTQDAAVLARLDGEQGLHQVVAMTPAPVRAASTLTGEQTLWVMRHGGLDIHDATDTALITATVA